MLTTNRWSEIVALFESALGYTGLGQQEFLDLACVGDLELREEVESLLHADAIASGFFSEPGDGRGALDRPSLLGAIPKQIGPYRIVDLIGRGGMGTVCLAERDRDFKRTVAVKILNRFSQSPYAIARFRREREILSSLEHPNIARLYGGGLDSEVGLYIAMEFVDGVPITEYCDSRDLSVTERLELFISVCEATAFAHRNLVVHRDLKPANIFVTHDGVTKLLDFGIAKWTEPVNTERSSTIAHAVMTPAYASPEQVLGQTVTTATDVYSLGVVLYELVTATRPYNLDGVTQIELFKAITESIPRYPSQVVKSGSLNTAVDAQSLRGDVDRIVLKSLSKNPLDRYESVDALREDIQLHLSGHPINSKSRRLGYVARKFVGRNMGAMVGASVAVLLIAISIGLWIDSQNRYRDEKATARGLTTYLVDLFEIADPALRSDTSITAKEILQVGRSQALERLGGNKSQFAQVMSLIGELYTKIGEFESGMEVHQMALDVLPNEPSDLRSDNLLGLAMAQFELGRYAEAEANLTAALDMRISLSGQFHPRTADILAAMSSLALEQDDLVRADSLVSEAMMIRSRLSLTNEQDIAQLLHRRGTLLRLRHDLDESVTLLVEAHNIYDTAGPEFDIDRAGVLNSLALAYTEMGEFERAGSSFQASQEIVRLRLGESHPRFGILLLNMAEPIEQIVDGDSASALIARALAILQTSKGMRHPDVSTALNHLAVRMRKAGDYVAAESLYVQSIDIAERTLSPNHMVTLSTKHNLAILLRIVGRPLEAMRKYQMAIDGYGPVGSRADFRRSNAFNGLGKVQRDLGLLDEAIESFRECLAIREQILEPGHWRLGTAHSLLGESLGMIGQNQEAEIHLRRGVEILESATGAGDSKAEEARERLEDFRQAARVDSSDVPILVNAEN